MSRLDFDAWEKGVNGSFLNINHKSNIREDWLTYDQILSGKYKNSIIKPINKYMQNLSIPPKLISIIDNKVTLCQQNFAEIYLLENKDPYYLRAIEKIHMRQFYLSTKINKDNPECFDPVFRWAMCWFIDLDNIEVTISSIDKSPFFFHEISYITKKEDAYAIDPKMLFFQFKKIGDHIKDDEYGRIKREQPAFLMSFNADSATIDRIKEFYGSN